MWVLVNDIFLSSWNFNYDHVTFRFSRLAISIFSDVYIDMYTYAIYYTLHIYTYFICDIYAYMYVNISLYMHMYILL